MNRFDIYKNLKPATRYGIRVQAIVPGGESPDGLANITMEKSSKNNA